MLKVKGLGSKLLQKGYIGGYIREYDNSGLRKGY